MRRQMPPSTAPTSGPLTWPTKLASRLREESGLAIPVVMGALVAALALGSTAVISTVGAQRGTIRDQDTKAAFAVAEAGVNEALLHYNRIPTTSGAPCLIGTVATASTTEGSGWCTGVTHAVTGVDGGSYTYWVRPTEGQLEVVSQGNLEGVSRQVEIVARSSANREPFGEASVIGLNFIHLDSNAAIAANVATNGDITMDSNSELICNYVEVGPGHSVIQGSNAHYTCPAPVHDTTSLPPVNQGDVATNNSNGRFFSNIGANPGDLITGANGSCSSGYIGTKRVCWNPTTRHLDLRQNSSLTLGGVNYSLCTLTLSSNSNVFIAAGAAISLYFDSPENCGLADGAIQLSMNSNSRISATGAANVAMYFVGSDALSTEAHFSSNTQANEACEQDFVVYGPRTDITMASNSFYCGAIAAKSIDLNSNSDIRTSVLGSDFQLPNVVDHYAPEEFVECSTAATNPPDAGC